MICEYKKYIVRTLFCLYSRKVIHCVEIIHTIIYIYIYIYIYWLLVVIYTSAVKDHGKFSPERTNCIDRKHLEAELRATPLSIKPSYEETRKKKKKA